MRDLQIDRHPAPSGAERAGGNGIGVGPIDAPARSYLLRRETRFPFRALTDEEDPIRLRRARRVSASFSAIPPLARNGRS